MSTIIHKPYQLPQREQELQYRLEVLFQVIPVTYLYDLGVCPEQGVDTRTQLRQLKVGGYFSEAFFYECRAVAFVVAHFAVEVDVVVCELPSLYQI